MSKQVVTIPTPPNAIELHKIEQQIEQISSVTEAVNATKYTAAITAAVNAAQASSDLQTQAVINRIKAERKLGELLHQQMPTQSRWNELKLDDIGITKNQSARAKKLASIPEDTLSEYLNEARLHGKDISLASALKLAARPASKKPKNNIHNLYASPPVDVQLGRELLERVGEDIADIINQTISQTLHTMPNKKQAYVWMRYHGINEHGEQDERWTFPRIAATMGGSTREYIENLYYRASSHIMEKVVARLVTELKQAKQIYTP